MNRLASPAQLRASFFRWALFLVPLVMLLGFLSGQFGGDAGSAWFQALEKPAIFPPPMWFGIVWSVLYLLMGLSFALVCSAWGARWRGPAIIAFIVQLAVNLAWTPIFFGAHEIGTAFWVIVVLDVLVLLTIWLVWKVRRLAAYLLLPYLAWILFATLLNWQFWQMNPDASALEPDNSVQRIEL
ncbi:TspO/MBR family protein [Paraurantiacibacter namhicola]|uniref:TspO/MBR family protein n=1 Tax=Paraurantiacibacter namhicola TaxID=645517 RepID=A0A1C7D816_9SPHN|nr:TspO/MBR family protein [Paraurantiacibacter namhicola]ANU07587.1 TspO/MBR family protein [Paraurantiacibacter namhicola]